MKKRVYAYLHTHWDREWYRDKEDFNIRLLDILDDVLIELKNNRAPFFYLDGQVCALFDYLKYRKEKYEEILNLIKNKKLAIGPYFVSADSFLVNGVCMLKNLELGLRYSKKFNQENFIGYMADIFGISNSAFSALKLKNIDKALIWRGVNPKTINNNANFIKNFIKTTWLTQGYFNDFFHQKNINVSSIKDYLDKIAKYQKGDIIFPIGADHLEILKDANKKIEFVNKKLDDYEIILTNPFEYFENAKYENNKSPVEFLDNSNTYTLKGVYSSRIYQKVKNALIQNKISRIVEPLDFYLGKKYIENIDYAYSILIKNHAHDSICACSTDNSAKSVDYRFLKCDNILNSILRAIMFDFKKKNGLLLNSKNKIGLFNLSNNDNIKVVEIKLPYILKNSQIIKKEKTFPDDLLSDSSKIPVTEDICTIYSQLVEVSQNEKFSFNTVKIKKPVKKTFVNSEKIENDYVSLAVKKGRVFIGNKKNLENYEFILTDIKDEGDSYNSSPSGEYLIYQLKNTKVIMDGLIQSTLRLNYSNICLDISLNNYSKFLKFKAIINNKKKNHKIQFKLLLKEKINKTISQDALGFIKRNIDPDYNIQEYMPALRPYELKSNCYPMQGFVCALNAIVLGMGLNEYEIYKNELRICLLRAIGTISRPKNKTRSIPAGPDIKTPDAQCMGKNTVEFALSFGDYKKAFLYLDEFFENYRTLEGNFRDELNFKLDKIPSGYYFLGLSEGEKILLNLKTNEVKTV